MATVGRIVVESDADRLASLKAVGELITVDEAKLWAIFNDARVEALDGLVGTSSPNVVARVPQTLKPCHEGLRYFLVGSSVTISS